VLALLADAGLPVDGVAELGELLVAVDATGAAVACAGLEVYGSAGLLRSVAVAAPLRGRGLGILLSTRMLERAAARGVRRVYLLTETAAQFFPRLGFVSIDREKVQGPVRTSVEFTRLCPASAAVMVVDLPVS
jgi:N-acetylglutamate synthase-like GNAT family acetyltransferase